MPYIDKHALGVTVMMRNKTTPAWLVIVTARVCRNGVANDRALQMAANVAKRGCENVSATLFIANDS